MENCVLLKTLQCLKDECMDGKLLLTQLEDASKVVFNTVALLDLLTLVNSTGNLHLGIYSVSGLRQDAEVQNGEKQRTDFVS